VYFGRNKVKGVTQNPAKNTHKTAHACIKGKFFLIIFILFKEKRKNAKPKYP